MPLEILVTTTCWLLLVVISFFGGSYIASNFEAKQLGWPFWARKLTVYSSCFVGVFGVAWFVFVMYTDPSGIERPPSRLLCAFQ